MKEKTLKTINPATGKELDTYEYFTDQEAKDAVEECHQAFLKWREKSPKQRAEVIKAIGEKLTEYKAELVKLMTAEMGKLLKQGEQEIDLCAGICEWTAANGPENLKDEERELPDGGRGIITYSPIGVIYGIQPWNFPAYQVIRYTIANLMAGNGVLLKHAESVTGSGLLLEKIFKEAGLPKDLFKVLLIDHDQSDSIIEHDLVRGVTLTGSPGAGKIIGEKAGANLKKTVLELGSNDAYLVLEDADIKKAVEWCVKGRVYNNGETCVAAKRFVVTEKVYDEFKEAFVEKMKNLKAGDPTSDESDLGPMAREDLREELHEQVEDSVKKGAAVLCGGKIPDGDGFYYPATVLANVKPGQPAYDDELFGPVASLIKAKDDEDAMRIANDSRFGLGGGIFSEDVDKAVELASKHFDTGMVFINSFGLAQPNMPFGGVKNSGYGREHGGFGLKEFVNAKAINILNG
ncbi:MULTISPECIES: NAD-dependent succinate-semialdehyde dehydrogenase [Salegentibacter]|jgi:succinate-semialdehyde dehydrogenase/glutarate-semialdehyde dehydrogenase|uniref:Succinate-semialdehyde dehydrogenase / glutarate-semialdehyde dehydrogenase n=1 Tax=Salegentibacter agarivorans TaxID=345907 RepID=A0A1I2JWY3_9FLAO|nr:MULTISPECIES: NAD-dependent succinate-semialdehyde dehydrogenase [Salegentibacter]APS39135.1 succinate-semialdehyde dehydrogenase [Salegentibacter sp. T436]MBO2544607.1 NAD-dependent succinate-semialdehyde dehydrogenase [Salegentibacter sp. BDJ18]SFF58653.1 succinate-semialdehyde dehydrogenase / glutarate-semialdehyde dehydrogenase [Salegentibacter agarivorans]